MVYVHIERGLHGFHLLSSSLFVVRLLQVGRCAFFSPDDFGLHLQMPLSHCFSDIFFVFTLCIHTCHYVSTYIYLYLYLYLFIYLPCVSVCCMSWWWFAALSQKYPEQWRILHDTTQTERPFLPVPMQNILGHRFFGQALPPPCTLTNPLQPPPQASAASSSSSAPTTTPAAM